MTPALKKALADLNACMSADAVAGLLRDDGCRGERKSPCNCPVAVYLKNAGEPEASVGHYTASVNGIETVGLSQSVELFIIAFDGGAYPELLAE